MKTLIWKEWRQQRLLVFVTIGAVLASYFFLKVMPFHEIDRDFLSVSELLLLLLFSSTFLGVNAFTSEFSARTEDFLLSKPATVSRIFWTKFVFGLFLLYCLILISSTVLCSGNFSSGSEFGIDTLESLIFHLILLYTLIYSAAFFTSLMVHSSLTAILCTPFMIVLGALLVSPLLAFLFFGTLFESQLKGLSIVSICILTSLFAIFGFVVWRSAVSKGMNRMWAVASCAIVTLLLGVVPIMVYASRLFPILSGHILAASVYILISLFVFWGLLICGRVISKGANPSKTFLYSAIVMLLVSFGIHAIGNMVSSRQLDRAIQRARRLGIKLTLQEIIPPPVPEKENSALIYQEAFTLAEKLRGKYAKKWDYMPYAWEYMSPAREIALLEELTPEQKENIAHLLLQEPDFLKVYSLIEKAVSLPSCRFNLRYEDRWEMPLSHLHNMRQLGRMLAARTYILSEEKKYREAFESARVGLQLGDSLADEPLYRSQIIRRSIDATAFKLLARVLDSFSEEISIEDYHRTISEVEKKEKEWTKILEWESALLEISIFEEALRGDSRFIRNLPYRLLFRFYESYLERPVLKRDYALFIRHFTEGVLLSRLPYYEARERCVTLQNETENTISRTPMNFILSRMLCRNLPRMTQYQAEHHAKLDALKIALGLKIYRVEKGKYPEQLSSLVPDVIPQLPLDPFTGRDYVYRKAGKGFMVYSVGANLEDNRGILNYPRNKGYDDIAWRCKE